MNKFKNAVVSLKSRAAAAGTGVAALIGSGAAMASAPSGGFDASTVVAKITENGATALTIVGAFILAVWGLKAMGLLKRG